jgi:hypothetical protein
VPFDFSSARQPLVLSYPTTAEVVKRAPVSAPARTALKPTTGAVHELPQGLVATTTPKAMKPTDAEARMVSVTGAAR